MKHMVFAHARRRGARLSGWLRIALLNLLGGLFAAALAAVLLFSLLGRASGAEPDEGLRSHDHYLVGKVITREGLPVQGPMPDGALPVVSIAIDSAQAGWEGFGGIYYQNNTDYRIDFAALSGGPPPLPAAAAEGPQVLIYHTHTSEAYSSGLYYYDPAASTYLEDPAKNVVAVGDTLAAGLERLGVKTLQDATPCDRPVFNQSYANSLSLAGRLLEQHPSIRLVVDLHRDSMINQEGIKYRPLLQVDGVATAQLMLVVGSPGSGLEHPNWQQNLQTAMRLYALMEELAPGIMRPIHISKNRYNQHLAPGAILVEVGSCANTLEQAQAAAELLAEGIAQLLAEAQG
ncbi:MAG: hypothetical protein GXX99_08145 [Clostridiales bacterium]|nr:hypothetical protein [Clostridiales bacterium]